jgi:transcriptional regulator with XRE-family HTH domain
VSTAEAIHRLRKKLGLRQPEFARRLGVTVTSVSRYENGAEPSTAVLTRLMQLCGSPLSSKFSPEMASLRSLFEAKRRSDIVSALENLASRGTNRGVSVTDLRLLQAGLRLIGVNMKRLIFDPSVTGEQMQQIARESFDMAYELLDVITPYLSFAPEVRSGDTNEALLEVEMILKENLSPEGAAELAALASKFASSEVKQKHRTLDELRALRTNVTLGPDRMAEWAAEKPSIYDSASGKTLRPEELSSEVREQAEQQSRAKKQRAEDARRQSARPTDETQAG